jgi:Protein of unknown function with HXXEE motif
MDEHENPGRLVARVALLAPVVFAIHVLEEAPGFVPWFNSLVKPPITQGAFVSVNLGAAVITLLLVAVVAGAPQPLPATVLLAWLALLMGANGLFHIVATAVHGRYSPGVVTAAGLYLPYFVWYFSLVVRRLRVPIPAAAVASIVGALPMLVHGYLIVFRGSRLF